MKKFLYLILLLSLVRFSLAQVKTDTIYLTINKEVDKIDKHNSYVYILNPFYEKELKKYHADSIAIYKDYHELIKEDSLTPPPVTNNYNEKPTKYFTFLIKKRYNGKENLKKYVVKPCKLKGMSPYENIYYIKLDDNEIVEAYFLNMPKH